MYRPALHCQSSTLIKMNKHSIQIQVGIMQSHLPPGIKPFYPPGSRADESICHGFIICHQCASYREVTQIHTHTLLQGQDRACRHLQVAEQSIGISCTNLVSAECGILPKRRNAKAYIGILLLDFCGKPGKIHRKALKLHHCTTTGQDVTRTLHLPASEDEFIIHRGILHLHGTSTVESLYR